MRRNGEFAPEVFYFGVVKAGLSKKRSVLRHFGCVFTVLLSPRTPDLEKQRGLSSWNALVLVLGVGWEL